MPMNPPTKMHTGKRTWYKEVTFKPERPDKTDIPVGKIVFDYDTQTFEFIDNGNGVVATAKLWAQTDFWADLCGFVMDEAVNSYAESAYGQPGTWNRKVGSGFAASVQNFLKAGCDPREDTNRWRASLGTEKVAEEVA